MYKAISLKDEKCFNIDILGECVLIIKLQENCFSFTVWHPQKKKFIAYERIPVYKNLFTSEASLQDIWKQHQYISAGFWKKVILIIHNFNYTLAPSNFFVEKTDILALLKLNNNFHEKKFSPISFAHHKIGCDLFFLISSHLEKWLEEKYKVPKMIFHSSSCFLEYIISHYSKRKQKTFYIHIFEESFTIVIIDENGKLILVNSFCFVIPQDVIYYILFVAQECKIDIKKIQLLIWGDREENAEIYDLLSHFISSIKISSFEKDKRIDFYDVPSNEEVDLFYINQYS